MRIAIVGAGLAGLAACFHLIQKKCTVSLFDSQGIGGGASGIATGLLHPYPGEKARRSWNAAEALESTRKLLKISEAALGYPVASYSGILRYAIDAEQQAHLVDRTRTFDDIEQVGEREFLIHSGMTVYTPLYLKGLWQACRQGGAIFHQECISSLSSLDAYDHVILACGMGVFELAPIKLSYVKGQVLTARWPNSLPPLTRSLIGKGYVGMCADARLCHLGATFERNFTHRGSDQDFALRDLVPKIAAFFPQVHELSIVGCQSNFRVTRPGSYLPLIERFNEKCSIFTALGSRGLLYHAYFAEILSRNVLNSVI